MAAVPAVASAPGAPSAPGVPAPGAPPVHVSPKDPPTRCTPPRAVFKFEDHRYTYEYGGFATWAEGQTRGTAVVIAASATEASPIIRSYVDRPRLLRSTPRPVEALP